MERKQTVANVLLTLSFFLLPSRCCCDADVERQVKEIQNNQTAAEIILPAKSREMSGTYFGKSSEKSKLFTSLLLFIGNGNPSEKLKSDEWMSDNYIIGTVFRYQTSIIRTNPIKQYDFWF